MVFRFHWICLALFFISGQALACRTWLPCDNQPLNVRHIHDDLAVSSRQEDLTGKQGHDDWQVERHFNPLDRTPSATIELSRGLYAELAGKRKSINWDVTRKTQDLTANRVNNALTVNHDHQPLSKGAREEITWAKTDSLPLTRGADTDPLARCD